MLVLRLEVCSDSVVGMGRDQALGKVADTGGVVFGKMVAAGAEDCCDDVARGWSGARLACGAGPV